jgi:hypothetical protein
MIRSQKYFQRDVGDGKGKEGEGEIGVVLDRSFVRPLVRSFVPSFLLSTLPLNVR